MSDTKLTLGKWVCDDKSKFTDISKGSITYSGPSLKVKDTEVNVDGVISTVSMFKAAPHMYKALECLMELNEEDDVEYLCGTDLFNQIKSVMAKARGKS